MRRLDPKERVRLKSLFKEIKDPCERDSTDVIIALDKGHSPSESKIEKTYV